jgi:hypothetical protein
VVEPSFPS